jgi:Ran GTPase-activating protein (RanGAP) involved in mRNA processing and transport
MKFAGLKIWSLIIITHLFFYSHAAGANPKLASIPAHLLDVVADNLDAHSVIRLALSSKSLQFHRRPLFSLMLECKMKSNQLLEQSIVFRDVDQLTPRCCKALSKFAGTVASVHFNSFEVGFQGLKCLPKATFSDRHHPEVSWTPRSPEPVEFTKILDAIQESIVSALDFSFTNLNDRDVNTLIPALENSHVNSLQFGRRFSGPSHLSRLGLTKLTRFVGALKLKRLSVQDLHIDTWLAELMVQNLGASPLELLDFGGNMILDRGALAVGKAMKLWSLEALNLESNGITGDGVKELGEALAISRKLTKLFLQNSQLGLKGIQNLASGLSASRLQLLDLTSTKLDDEAAELLFQSLPRTLESLRVGLNKFEARGVSALSLFLISSKLKFLDVSKCGITTKQLQMLLPGLLKSNIQTLILAGNPLGDEGITALASYLPIMRIRRLDISDTQVSSESLSSLAFVLYPEPMVRVVIGLEISQGNQVVPITLDNFVKTNRDKFLPKVIEEPRKTSRHNCWKRFFGCFHSSPAVA